MNLNKNQAISEDHLYKKNYALGVPLSINVGDTAIRVEDYWVRTGEAKVAKANISSTVQHGIGTSHIDSSIEHPIWGTTIIDGQSFSVVGILTSDSSNRMIDIGMAVLINASGEVNKEVMGGIASGSFTKLRYSPKFSNPSVKFTPQTTKSISTTKGYTNYEIIYNGKNATSLNFTYREFSPEGLARVAFFQNLTYEANAELITFKNLKIKILKSSSSELGFVVTSD